MTIMNWHDQHEAENRTVVAPDRVKVLFATNGNLRLWTTGDVPASLAYMPMHEYVRVDVLGGYVLGADCDALLKQAASDAKFAERKAVVDWLLHGMSGGAKMPSSIASAIVNGAHLNAHAAAKASALPCLNCNDTDIDSETGRTCTCIGAFNRYVQDGAS
jgi:hypothetical protein